MSCFRTILNIPPSEFKIAHDHRIMMLGSCFTDNIGAALDAGKFQVHSNPYGVIYNPYSVQEVLQHILGFRKIETSDLVQVDGIWHSYLHHGSFGNAQKELLEEQINITRNEALNFLQKADYLFITFGTAWVYQLKKTRHIVANCHKMPESNFHRFRLSTCDIVDEFNQLIRYLAEMNPNLKIVFTVSPVRHLRDGAVENQVSKALLTIAVHELIGMHSHCSYFPSYEIVMDDLRDYRFYADDMVHLNNQAIRYVFERFSQAYFSPSTVDILGRVQKIQQALTHRPFNDQSAEHLMFLQKTKTGIEQLSAQFKTMNWVAELKEINNRIAAIESTNA